MGMLAKVDNTIFVGQAVAYPGQAAYETFREVPYEKRVELPVCEDFQLGLSTGLALSGFLPISFFPRWDFLVIAANQLLNHLDKMNAKVIIRTAVGRTQPFDPGPQHTQNYTFPIRQMLTNIRVMELLTPDQIMPAYEDALRDPGSCIMVEHMRFY